MTEHVTGKEKIADRNTFGHAGGEAGAIFIELKERGAFRPRQLACQCEKLAQRFAGVIKIK